jgi:orotidine-5'-phosphate decarboxylase
LTAAANSRASIPNNERLIFALDVPDAARARAMVELLGDSVRFYKIGLELCMSGEYFELLDWLVARGKKVFVDLKFFDIPATVAGAVRRLNGRGVTFATVHGNQAIMEAAAAAKGDVKILATSTTSGSNATSKDSFCPARAARSRAVATASWHPAWNARPCANRSTTV